MRLTPSRRSFGLRSDRLSSWPACMNIHRFGALTRPDLPLTERRDRWLLR
jgi:hypothetical protein